MPNKTMDFRWFRPRIKTGVVESGDLAGNYIWGLGEPVLQQRIERTDAEVEMHKRLRGVDVPKTFWTDVPVVDDSDDD